LIREQYYNKTTIHIADNDVLAVHGQVIPRFIGQDGRHLSNEGIKVLATNLRSAVENVLKIGTYRRRRYADRSEHYGNYFSRQASDRRDTYYSRQGSYGRHNRYLNKLFR
jgi:uncharacterized protein (DUF3820 family)